MYKTDTNKITGEKVYKYELEDGLKVYICPKKGFSKKVGMYGTHFGSIDTDFYDIQEKKRKRVPDGIAHFLEHKLFEQEDGNALDLFAKMGVSSNAYTSYDHTVYFFETNDKFEECLKTLFDFITTPYFTDENVEKEKGIIEQELNMYEDSPDSVVYYNVMRAMYNNYPLNVDIGGTVESVYSITKEELYSCYNTFYAPQNMFVIIIGDVDIESTVKMIKERHSSTKRDELSTPQRFYPEEPENIAMREIEKKLDVFMPSICIGFKSSKKDGKTNIRNALITEIINEAAFSDLSDFYEDMYNAGLLTEPMYMTYESGKDFSHTLVFFQSLKHKECEEKFNEHLTALKENGISEELFNIVLNKKIGQEIYNSESMMQVSREVIDSIIEDTEVFEASKVLGEITVKDVNNYIKNEFNTDKMVISRVLPKD